MRTSTIAAATFGAAAFFVAAVAILLFDLFWRDRQRINQRVREEIGDGSTERLQSSSLFRDVQQWDLHHRTSGGWGSKLQVLIDQAGLNFTAGQLTATTIVLSVVVMAAVRWFASSNLVASVAGSAMLPLPLMYVAAARRRRIHLFCAQLPEAFEFMARAAIGSIAADSVSGGGPELPGAGGGRVPPLLRTAKPGDSG